METLLRPQNSFGRKEVISKKLCAALKTFVTGRDGN
jgi:hypothetical protein